MIKFKGFKSIQSNIAFTFSNLIVITILIMSFLSYKLLSESVEKNSKEYTYQLIEQVHSNIETYINYMENISQMVQSNYDVIEYLSSGELSKNEKETLENKITNQFKSIMNTREDINSIMVFGYDDKKFLSNKHNVKLNPYINPQNQSWYKKAIKANGQAIVSSSHVQNIVKDQYDWVVSLSKELKSNNTNNKLGIFLVDLNYSVINDICKEVKLGNKGYIFIVDNQGNIVYNPQQQLIYSNIKKEYIDKVISSRNSNFISYDDNNKKKIYTIKESSYVNWKIVGVTYADELVTNQKEIRNYYLIGGIVILTITILLSIILSSKISRPIKVLEECMEKVKLGSFDVKATVTTPNEVGQLSNTFNIMTVKIKDLIKQNTKNQEAKRKSDLKVLQSQINPHFLYNTLDSIIWMAESGNSKEVVLMTSSLSKLFRLSISNGNEIITIENELEHIKNYLTIQKMRYLDKLDFIIEVNAEILMCKILKIILQPLVENSIYHGIKNKTDKGIIKIIGKNYDDTILLKVIDNGVGMTEEEIENIFIKNKQSSNKNTGSGVGVKNVNERIKLYFGNEYGLEYKSITDLGTTVYIYLPKIE
ncbi:MAG: sensor histidine kinase [Clostridiales bacterium]